MCLFHKAYAAAARCYSNSRTKIKLHVLPGRCLPLLVTKRRMRDRPGEPALYTFSVKKSANNKCPF